MDEGQAPGGSLQAESRVVAAGRPAPGTGAPLNSPIVLAAPFGHDAATEANAYLRNESSDTVRAFEEAVGALEGGYAVAFASGMAAVAAIADGLPAGTTVVVPESAYSGTVGFFGEQHRLGRLITRPVDVADTDAVRSALPGAQLLWTETVTNPLMGVVDLTAVIEAAHEAGASVAVDATFSTPLLVRPLALGADVVMHSATKYLSGHSDVVLGVAVTASPGGAEDLRERRARSGAVPGALETYLALRGIRTLALRIQRAQDNAMELALRLRAHPSVVRVRYPGLPDDPGHERAARLHAGFGAMISFEVAGTAEDAERVCRSVRLITHATSLGGVESLIERRARYEIDAAHGSPPTLLRFSVGIEHVEDLWADLERALAR